MSVLNYPEIERRHDHLSIEDRFNQQDKMLIELKEIILTHINDEKDLTPVLKELVKTWEAAHWLVNIIKWVGIIAGAVAAFVALLKGTKP
jgi:hypothetical protein